MTQSSVAVAAPGAVLEQRRKGKRKHRERRLPRRESDDEPMAATGLFEPREPKPEPEWLNPVRITVGGFGMRFWNVTDRRFEAGCRCGWSRSFNWRPGGVQRLARWYGRLRARLSTHQESHSDKELEA